MYRLFVVILILIMSSTAVYAEQLKFVQLTDCHLSFSDGEDNGRDFASSEHNLEAAVESINKLNDISFVIFSGDNIDKANMDLLVRFNEIVKKLNMPYYISLGNHDVSRFQRLGKFKYIQTVKKYDKYQKSKKPFYYFLPNSDFIVIVMDGVHEVVPNTHGSYSAEDLTWLDNVLTKYSDKKAIIIQHFPLIEPYVNKSHRLLEPEAYFDLLPKHKNIIAILSGHYHHAKVTLKDGIYHISSPALVNKPHEYRVIEIDYDRKSLFEDPAKFDLKTDLVPVQ